MQKSCTAKTGAKACTEAGLQLEQMFSLIQLHYMEIQFGCRLKVLPILTIDLHGTSAFQFFLEYLENNRIREVVCTFFLCTFFINFGVVLGKDL